MYSERIKDLRRDKCLTQIQLANILEVSKGTIAMWETGKRRPSYEALEAMSKLFNKPMDYIMGYSEDVDRSKFTWRELDKLDTWYEENSYYEIIRNYFRLDHFGKMAVENLISQEINRCLSQQCDVNIEHIDFSIKLKAECDFEEEEMKQPGHITRALKELGPTYTVKVIDMAECVYKSLQNGIDFEVTYGRYEGYIIYVWLRESIIVETTETVRLKDLKTRMEGLERKYKDIDKEKFEKEIVEKFWGKCKELTMD
ncbi:MAG: helix-turn-helix transcriptional regulator [Clostridium sp.]|nr:helix-turn-helix transcriptional regulator [Clostridium sp.]MDU7084341.1 helix-turn-helix transcriptional regulator [Clostridium sp.]